MSKQVYRMDTGEVLAFYDDDWSIVDDIERESWDEEAWSHVVAMSLAEVNAICNGYELDLFSTFLSRSTSGHVLIGSKRYVKPIRR